MEESNIIFSVLSWPFGRKLKWVQTIIFYFFPLSYEYFFLWERRKMVVSLYKCIILPETKRNYGHICKGEENMSKKTVKLLLPGFFCWYVFFEGRNEWMVVFRSCDIMAFCGWVKGSKKYNVDHHNFLLFSPSRSGMAPSFLQQMILNNWRKHLFHVLMAMLVVVSPLLSTCHATTHN